MTKEKLFELAVSLTAANIQAGQANNAMNFATIVRDDTQAAFDILQELWSEVLSVRNLRMIARLRTEGPPDQLLLILRQRHTN